MNILIIKFPEEQKKFIKGILSKTTFKKSNHFEFPNLEEAQKNKIWKNAKLILCYGRPEDIGSKETVRDLNRKYPIIFITDNNVRLEIQPSILSDIPCFISVKKVTSFVLEKCIFNTIEKVRIKAELDDFKYIRKELELKEEKLRNIYNNSSFGMYEIDPDGNFIMANTVFIEMLGLKNLNELKQFNAFKPGFSRNGNREKIRKLLKLNGEINGIEDSWIDSNMREMVIKEHIKVKRNNKGKVEYYHADVENITKRKKAEQISKKSDIRFKSIIESAIDAIVISDAEGKILVWNKSAQNIFGYSEEEIINQSIDIIVPEAHRGNHNMALSRFIETRQPKIMGTAVKVEGLRKDKSIVPISLSLSHWEEDESIYFSAIIKDITKQKQEEEKSITSEIIFKNSIDMLCIAGFDGFFKVLNPAWTRILGWSKEELLSKPWIEFVHPEDKSKTNDTKSEIVDGRKVFQFENRYITKDGDFKWLSWNSIPRPEEKIIVGVARDVTEEKKQESRIKVLQQVIEQNPLSILVTNTEGNIEYVNPKFNHSSGFRTQEVIGEKFKLGEIYEEEYKKLWDTVLSGKEWQGEHQTKRKNGETFWERTRISPIYDNKGIITHFIVVKEDITSRKEFETELINSKKNSEKSDRLKSEFLAQISHEVRTPVNTLISFASLLKEELSDKISQDLIPTFVYMDSAANRLTRTIDMLIKMSELQTDNYEPEFIENDLIEILQEVIYKFKKNAEEKKITLELIERSKVGKIIFDKNTIIDVFNNLIDNAIKFTDKGTVNVIVERTVMDKISVQIKDTGIGISPQYIGDLYNLFSQESQGHTRKYDGNGLGLSLVKQSCDLNNVEISVISEKREGSTFALFFK